MKGDLLGFVPIAAFNSSGDGEMLLAVREGEDPVSVTLMEAEALVQAAKAAAGQAAR